MATRFNNPELQLKIDQWSTETGRSADELVENVMAGYFDELAAARDMLNSRYDGIQSGEVKMIPGDQVIARLRKRSESYRLQNSK